MSTLPPAWALVVGFVASSIAAALAIPLARRAGFGDAPRGDAAWRKLQDRPVPPIGGPAILIGLVAVRCAGALPWGSDAHLPFVGDVSERAAWCALFVGFATGAIDDALPSGLSPRAKLAGQALAGFALAFPTWLEGSVAAALAASLAAAAVACFATNVWNTFDNADGAATAVAGLGLCAVGAPGAGAALGFLPWNLLRPRAENAEVGGAARARAPRAYLGDSGSHLLGLLVLLVPAAWPLFLLPAADLARLVVVRLRRGSAPWRGDRRHLAHRLQGSGLGAGLVACVLAAIGLAPVLVGGAAGLALGLAGFGLALALSPDPDRVAGP